MNNKKSSADAKCYEDDAISGRIAERRVHEACARAAHEANRAYCIALGDLSQPSWDDAPEWQKSSATNGIRVALEGATPEQQHEAWMRDKIADGWKLGPVKDVDKKEHHCLVPYAALPETQRAKDALFTTVVRAMSLALGG